MLSPIIHAYLPIETSLFPNVSLAIETFSNKIVKNSIWAGILTKREGREERQHHEHWLTTMRINDKQRYVNN